MSFIDSAMELLDRTEASLHSLLTDALKAKAYGEIATIAGLAQSIAAISPARAREGSRMGMSTTPPPLATPSSVAADTAKAAEPSWMRPKNP